MKKYTHFIIILAISYSCRENSANEIQHSSLKKDTPDYELEKRAILSLHNDQKKAHFEKNVSLLLGDSSIDFIEVNRGLIKKPSYSENYDRFKHYFDAVEFIKWDDITPPVISFSDDASIATSVVEKLVITRNISGNNLDTTQFAWLAVYKKENGKWKLHRIASTNK